MLKDDRLLTLDDPLLTPHGSIQELKSYGLPISASWFEKLCLASKGPPVDCYWGRRPMRKRSTLRNWAAKRMKRTEEHGLHDAKNTLVSTTPSCSTARHGSEVE